MRYPGLEDIADCELAFFARNTHDPNAFKEDHIVYVGNEFCDLRLPSIEIFRDVVAMCNEKKCRCVLVTPYSSDNGIGKIVKLLDILQRFSIDKEVVINDWGVLSKVSMAFPELPYIIGRLIVSRYLIKFHCGKKWYSFRKDVQKKRLFWEFPDHFLEFPLIAHAQAFEFNDVKHICATYEQLKNKKIRLHMYYPFIYHSFSRYCRVPQGYVESFPTERPECSRECEKSFLLLENRLLENEFFLNGNVCYQYQQCLPNDFAEMVDRIVINDFSRL
jgi:hypothetical protein